MKGKEILIGSIIGVCLLVFLAIGVIVLATITHGSFAEYRCNLKSGGYQYRCYEDIALDRDDYLLCQKVGNGLSSQRDCLELFKADLNQVSDCEVIESEPLHSNCIGFVAGNHKDISLCQDLDSHSGFCYISVAVEAEDASICEEIDATSLYYINECIIHVAAATKDETLCEELNDGITKQSYRYEQCLAGVAASTGEVSRCEEIYPDDNSRKALCIKDVAFEQKNPSLCPMIEEEYHKDKCYIDLAADLDERSLCDQVVRDNLKDSCIEFF